MTFKRVNNITGWIVCAIACTVYIMTMEATGSFWDCGEFISSTFKMQVPHPPGAPLFVMLGRLFIVAFSGFIWKRTRKRRPFCKLYDRHGQRIYYSFLYSGVLPTLQEKLLLQITVLSLPKTSFFLLWRLV